MPGFRRPKNIYPFSQFRRTDSTSGYNRSDPPVQEGYNYGRTTIYTRTFGDDPQPTEYSSYQVNSYPCDLPPGFNPSVPPPPYQPCPQFYPMDYHHAGTGQDLSAGMANLRVYEGTEGNFCPEGFEEPPDIVKSTLGKENNEEEITDGNYNYGNYNYETINGAPMPMPGCNWTPQDNGNNFGTEFSYVPQTSFYPQFYQPNPYFGSSQFVSCVMYQQDGTLYNYQNVNVEPQPFSPEQNQPAPAAIIPGGNTSPEGDAPAAATQVDDPEASNSPPIERDEQQGGNYNNEWPSQQQLTLNQLSETRF